MANLPPIPGHCPSCGHYNDLTARFCAQCGSELAVAAPNLLREMDAELVNEEDEIGDETTGTVPVAAPTPVSGQPTQTDSWSFDIEPENPATVWKDLEDIPTIHTDDYGAADGVVVGDETTVPPPETDSKQTTEQLEGFTHATTMEISRGASQDDDSVDFMEDSSYTDTNRPLWDTDQTMTISEAELVDENVRDPQATVMRSPDEPGTHQGAIPTMRDSVAAQEPGTHQAMIPTMRDSVSLEQPGEHQAAIPTMRATAELMPCVLVVLGRGGNFQAIRISNIPKLVGKHKKCELVLVDELVSRFHAMFQVLGDRHYVIDVKSRRGTFLNGESVMQASLRDGDVMRLGDTHIIYFGKKVYSIEQLELKAPAGSFVPVPLEQLPAGEPRMAFVKGSDVIRAFPGRPCVIGSHDACGWKLESEGVAAFHAQIVWLKGDPHLIDLGSGMGTFVNRTPVDDSILRSGDEVQLGRETFIVRFVKNPPPIVKEVSEMVANIRSLWVTCIRGQDRGMTHVVAADEKPIVLGRHESADVVLNDPQVAGQHASLRMEGNKLAIQDMTGRRLTVINGSPSAEGKLVAGQLFKVGHNIFLVHYDIAATVYR